MLGNVCINEEFKTADGIVDMPRIVNEKCGFGEFEPLVTKIAKLEAELKAITAAINEQNDKIEKCEKISTSNHRLVKSLLMLLSIFEGGGKNKNL